MPRNWNRYTFDSPNRSSIYSCMRAGNQNQINSVVEYEKASGTHKSHLDHKISVILIIAANKTHKRKKKNNDSHLNFEWVATFSMAFAIEQW